MKKKSTKVLSGALATTTVLGSVMGATPAMAANNVDQLFNVAYTATEVAKTAKTQEKINEARKAVRELKEALKNDPKLQANLVGNLSSQLDPLQQEQFVAFYSVMYKEDKKTLKDSLTQSEINKSRDYILAFKGAAENEKYITSWSTAVDEFQQANVNKVAAAVKKAETSKLEADVKEARKLVDELLTVTNNDTVKDFAQGLEIQLSKIEKELDEANKALNVSSISSITTNTVSVVLTDAPVRELTVADFKVAGNSVTKIEKGNFDSVYTLTLGTSLDNKKGTLTVNGASKEYDFTQLKINSVSTKNLRQLEVKFSKELYLHNHTQNIDGTYTVNELLPQLHIWMTTEESGSTSTKSIAKILGTNVANWDAFVQPDKKTVVIQAKDGSMINEDANKGLGLKINETYELEALNVLDSTGKSADVSYVTNTLMDTTRPTFTADSKVYSDTNLLKVYFSEPMMSLKNKTAKVYIDGTLIADEAITDVVNNTTVYAHSHISIDTTKLGYDLTKGTHTLTVVGAQDLNNNVVSNNGKEVTFTYVEPADVAEVTPIVNNVTQVADNAFKLVFNTTNVKQKDNLQTSIVIKKGAFDSVSGEYKDIKLGKDNILINEVDATATIPAHTEWIVVAEGTAQADAAKFSYKGANVISRDIVLNNFHKDTVNGKDGKECTKNLTFKKDTSAPVISSDSDALAVNGISADTINVKFSDGPFITDGNGKVKLPDVAQKVTVKYTDEKGVTYTEEVLPVLDPANEIIINLKITNPKMLTNTGKLIAGASYTLVLPDGVVKDKFESAGIGSLEYKLDEEAHPFLGKTVVFKVPGASDLQETPQTTKGLIFTGKEVKDDNGAFASKVKAANKIELKDNQVVVVFEGDVDSKTATKLGNYTLNGKVLPNGTIIEYREDNIDGVDGEEHFAIITLADNTVALTGGQDFTVANVANKDGKKMMPVADVVTLSDNTNPVAKSVEIKDSNKIVVNFSEEIKITAADMTQLAKNFVINANGKTISLINAVKEDRTKLVITLADNFDNNGSLSVPVSVKLQKNADGDMFVTDMAENKAKEVTVTK